MTEIIGPFKDLVAENIKGKYEKRALLYEELLEEVIVPESRIDERVKK